MSVARMAVNSTPHDPALARSRAMRGMTTMLTYRCLHFWVTFETDGCRANRAVGSSTTTMEHGRPRVLPLQTVSRGRRAARLLDDDRSGAHSGSLGGSARRMGAAARDRRVLWRPADLRLAPIDHVFTPVLLLLRASEEKLPRALRLSGPHAEGSSGAARRSRIEVQGRSHHSDQASGRGRAARHRLASRSLRTL